jgi:hypothetical protein
MIVISQAKMLRKGLKYAGFSHRRQANVGLKTNVGRFKSFYGSTPAVYTVILEDLQATENPSAQIILGKHTLKHFLLAMHWLRTYKTEAQLSGLFGFDEKTCRKYVWYYTSKMQALKEEKVSSLLRRVRRWRVHCWLVVVKESHFAILRRFFGPTTGRIMDSASPSSFSQLTGSIALSESLPRLPCRRTPRITATSTTMVA